MSHPGLEHSHIYHPDHSSVEFWKILYKMDYKEGHACPGNLDDQVDPSVNGVVETGMRMPTPLYHQQNYE